MWPFNPTLTIPAWYAIAEEEIGEQEVVGGGTNAAISEYLGTVNGGSSDETPWCSAFVNWCMEEAGIAGTESAAARSWLKWGKKLSHPKFGCVVVLWRGEPAGWKGHVGFFVAKDNDRVFLLGGNQNDKVCIKGYPLSRVLGYRWRA